MSLSNLSSLGVCMLSVVLLAVLWQLDDDELMLNVLRCQLTY